MITVCEGDPKYEHLKKLENASEKLKLFKADLLDYDSISDAIQGCNGVFHVASPVPSTSVPNPQASLLSSYFFILVEFGLWRLVYLFSFAKLFMVFFSWKNINKPILICNNI